MKIRYSIKIIVGLIIISSCLIQKEKTSEVEIDNQNGNETFQYDKDFPKYVEAKWEKKSFEKENSSKFDFLKSLENQLKIKDESILSKKFMSKPTINNLLAHYLDNKLTWNSYNFGNKKVSSREVIGKELGNMPSEKEMLTFYYNTIFSHILNNQRTISPYKLNLDFEELGLNETEGTIMFLSAMRFLGIQISSYSEKPENCWRAMEFVKKIPTFNGVTFDKFQLKNLVDFKLTIDKRFPKKSFKEEYIPKFEDAKIGFKKCLEIENKN